MPTNAACPSSVLLHCHDQATCSRMAPPQRWAAGVWHKTCPHIHYLAPRVVIGLISQAAAERGGKWSDQVSAGVT